MGRLFRKFFQRMKRTLFIFLVLLSCLPVFSQEKQNAESRNGVVAAGKTYAVIVGIANYENENLNLNYANRDAQEFAFYLQSKSGGEIPAENIRLLIDTNATTAAIYNALTWLRNKCEEDKRENGDKTNLVYFYFSGHGDVETETKASLGFLLSFNTPLNNYLNNAVRIEDLNNYAHTLSVDLNANVIIITDACHSGKLAGSDNRGTFLVGKELSTAREKEIRIASCNPDQLSNENIRWGGGRGVFSFYLINGLKGLADKNGDHDVTLSEIKNYVDSSIAADPVLKENKLTQTPVLTGKQQFKLASVNPDELISLQNVVTRENPPLTGQEYFFELMKKEDRLELINYDQLNGLPADDIALAFIGQAKKLLNQAEELDKVSQWENLLKNDKDKLQSFKETLADALHSRGQQVINLYLEGDAAELERRRYYNSKSSGYDIYVPMYSLALKLTDAGNPLTNILRVNQLYFKGVAARIKIPLVEESKQKKLIDSAWNSMTQALALSDQAAYIHNELGILNKLKKDYPEAEKYFTNATILAPSWALPWANLCGMYAETRNFEKADEAGKEAERLQPGLSVTMSNLGIVNEFSGNWLYAEEYYRLATDLNSRHYFPFERLGYVYMSTTGYAEADSFFFEADLRKKGFHFQANDLNIVPVDFVEAATFEDHCDIDTLALLKDDIMAFFTWGTQEYQKNEYSNAERIYKKVVALDKKNPLVFHYLGKIFYDQKNWEKAEVMFRFAVSYYLNEPRFKRYCDSLTRNKKYPYKHDCFERFFRGHYYAMIEDYYFLSNLYDSWGHYDESESYLRKIIAFNPADLGGYVKLWRMLEKLGRHTEAEKVIKSFAAYNKERSDRELNEFYRRTARLFPDNGDWPYRLGLFLYERASNKSRAQYFDTIIWFPKINKEVFMDFENYDRIGKDLNWDKNLKGSPKLVDKKYLSEWPQSIRLPGINETIQLADAIYTPRKDAITYLLKADSLMTEPETKADINFKVGNVFVWSGSKKMSYPYYTRSVELMPGNAGARLTLVDICKALYKNRAGLEHLNYLYDHQQISFPKRLLFAEFCIHSSQFDKAKKLIEEAQGIHPYVVPETFDLLGRLNMLSGQSVQAIKFYKDYLLAVPNQSNTLYTLAGLYAKTGNNTEAWKWLEESLVKGFRYSWVLQFDQAWKNFRNTKRWDDLMKRFPMKKYESHALATN